MTGTVLTERRGAVLEITLNRPDVLNAFTDELHADLRAAVTEAESDEVRAVILTGAGRGFCAGADLNSRRPVPGETRDLSASLKENYNPLILRIRALNKPVIAAVNGAAAGAGANLALACDIVLAAKSAKFLQAFARIGLVPDAGGTYTLPRLVGEARAKALMLLAEPITAEQAESFGMIWKTFEDDQLMAEARAMADRLANAPTFGLGLAKQLIQDSDGATLEEQLAAEAAAQFRCGNSPDFEEGVMAFLEKRKPAFTGKEE